MVRSFKPECRRSRRRLPVLAAAGGLFVATAGSHASTVQFDGYAGLPFPYGTGPAIDISSIGVEDWVVVNVNQKEGASRIATQAGTNGFDDKLFSAAGGGTNLYRDDSANFTVFSYSGGHHPFTSTGTQAFYQYDNPKVDITVPSGAGTLTVWGGYDPVNGNTASTLTATLVNAGTTQTFDLKPFNHTLYRLEVEYDNTLATADILRIELAHTGGNNTGLLALALSVPEPGTLCLVGAGAAVLLRPRSRLA